MVSSPCSFKGGSILFLFMLLFLSTYTELDAAPFDPLYPKCMAVVGTSNNRYFDVNFCMEALHSDNGSDYAGDYETLSVIAVDLLTANATSTAAQIDSLLKRGDKGAPMRWCLQSCRALYGSILQMQPRCLDLVKAFRYGDAKSCLDQAARATELCEAEFIRSHLASPLKVEDDCALKLARLASTLLDHVDD